jgi:hypothetical protein
MGKEIYSKSNYKTRGEHNEDIKFGALNISSGTYMIRVSSEEQKGATTKTVKVIYLK